MMIWKSSGTRNEQQTLGLLLLWITAAANVSALPGSRTGECEINARLDFAGKKPPVVLEKKPTGQYKLAQPSIRDGNNSYIRLNDKRLLISCPGKRNSLSLGGNSKPMEANASCKYTSGHNIFDIEGKAYQTDQVQCEKRVTPMELMTKELCNGDGSHLKLGYKIGEFYDVIQVCHRLRDGMTYYSRHILDGSQFSLTGRTNHKQGDGGRPKFSVQNKALYRGFSPNGFFKPDVQERLLTKITGNPNLLDVKHEKFFARGHLTPNADFVLNTWRDVTFLYVNVQPQWQEINGGNWLKIEEAVRHLAVATGKKYEVITGTGGVLTLNHTKLYLDSAGQRLPVPESYIKLVREIESEKCVAFISNNIPLGEPPPHKCEDLCLQHRWPDLKDYKKHGYVYCCSYEGLQTAFPRTFPVLDCTGGTLKNGGHEGLDSTTDSSRVGTTTNSTGLGTADVTSGSGAGTFRLGQNLRLRHGISLLQCSMTKILLPVLTTWMVNVMQ